jgi:serine/threonine protein kinase/WD40 repeat protein
VRDAAGVARVLALDQWRRWKAGERISAENYLGRFPQVATDAEAALELIYGEMLVREELGERPTEEEYLTRFPQWAAGLQQQLQLHRDLDGGTAGSAPLSVSGEPTWVMGRGKVEDIPPAPPAIPGYQIVEVLGRGAMGVVYKALHLRLGRTVALKIVLAGGHASPTDLVRFLTEAELAARLRHPNTVQVYDIGSHQGLPYFTLEYIDAGTLAGRLKGQPVLPREAAAFLVPLAAAVEHAHRHGVIHRDLKPANVLLQRKSESRNPTSEAEPSDGGPPLSTFEPKIADFGLAKLAGAGPGLTTTGTALGTPSYMAPEQATGKGQEVGPSADVYALGAILYEMLTGRPPFVGATSMDTLTLVIHQEPVPPARLQPGVPRDLDTICLQCLQKTPAKRYASVRALAADLGRFLEGRPILARRASRLERGWRWCRRNPALAASTALAALLLVAVTVVSTTAAFRLDFALQQKAEAERKARLREAEALVGQAHGTRLSGRPGRRFEALEALGKAAAIGRELGQPTAWFDRLRNEAIAALALTDLHITQEFDGFPDGTVRMELSDDFEMYARTTDKGACTICRVADDSELASLPELGEPAQVRFGKGRFLGLRGTKTRRFQLWDLTGPKPSLRLEKNDDKSPVTNWTFHPDGRLLALAKGSDPDRGGAGSIEIYDVATGACVRRLEAKETGHLLFHPDAPFLATSSYFTRGIWLYDLRNGAALTPIVPPWREGVGLGAWSPNGQTLTVCAGDSDMIQQYAFDATAPALRPIGPPMIAEPRQGGSCIAYNPQGDRFVRRGWSGHVDLFDAISGQRLFSTPSFAWASEGYLCFERAGQRLAAARVGDRQQRVGLWSVADAREYRALVLTGKGVVDLGFEPATHPGNRLAALGLKSGGVALFDLQTGRELTHLPIGDRDKRHTSVSFDGTGNLLTNSFEGFFRWPLRPDPANASRLLVGPPEKLPFKPGNRNIATSNDGRVIAQSMWSGYGMAEFAGGWILHPGFPTPRWVEAGSSFGRCSVSPDGRFVGFSDVNGGSVKVYTADNAKCVWQSPSGKGSHCRFSPDGRWLATDADGGRLYAVGSWERGPQLGPGIPWDLTREFAVMGQRNGIYRLVELATGRELASLEEPERNDGQAALTPDGSKLVVTAKDGLRVWDLRRIRQELDELGLDWTGSPHPPATAPQSEPSQQGDAGTNKSLQLSPNQANPAGFGRRIFEKTRNPWFFRVV